MTGAKEKEGEDSAAEEAQEGSVVVVADDLVVVVEDVQEVVDLDAKPTIESSSKIFPPEHLGRI